MEISSREQDLLTHVEPFRDHSLLIRQGALLGFKGGDHAQKRFFDGICNNEKSLPKCQKPAFLTFINKFRFPLGSPYLTAYQKSILHFMYSTKCKKLSKSTVCSFCPSLTFFGRSGGGLISNILGYKGGWSTEKISDEERVIIESYPSNPTSLPFPIKNERSLRTCCCCLYCVTKKKSCGVNLWREFVCAGSRKGLKLPLKRVVVIELDA